MQFDKNTILAFLLIGVILIFINTDFYKQNFLPEQKPVPGKTEEATSKPARPDTSARIVKSDSGEKGVREGAASEPPKQSREPGRLAEELGEGEDVTVETELYTAVFSTRGASVKSVKLNNYFQEDSSRVELVGADGMGNLSVLLPTGEDTLDTSRRLFQANKSRIRLGRKDQSGELVFTLDLGEGRQIKKTYVFTENRYSVDLTVAFLELGRMVEGYSYFLAWRSGMPSTEPDFDNDMGSAKVFAYQGDAESFDAGDDFEPGDWDDPTDWVAVRTKYFAVAVIPKNEKGQAVRLSGEKIDVGRDEPWKRYGFELQMPFESRASISDEFTVYMGPLDYDIVKSYNVGLEDMMDLGPAIFRPFGKFVLWSFKLLHQVIPNWGWVIVVFSILIKIVLYPLTRKSYKSMKEMQSLQPLMQEINEKYKDNPQKKQQAIMGLYKEHGVNPLGGCIPMVLQMPLLFAMFNVFQSTIQLRGADFILWMNDLSRPDTIAHLPFSIPLYGDTVNILPLFMGIVMFFQQKMTMKDPKQKAMVYFMPIFFTLLFNSFPSGLNLYYALFNLFSIIQEKVIPHHPKSPEELKDKAGKKPKKKKRHRRKHDYIGRK